MAMTASSSSSQTHRHPSSSSSSASSSLLAAVLFFVLIPGRRALDCFKCVSFDGGNAACEDPFHNNYTTDVLEQPCMGGRKGRDGVFPATACIKLSGVFENGHRMVVRGCSLDSGSLTVDTELVRMSHCGGFYFDERYVSGCVSSCTEDACNAATLTTTTATTRAFFFLTIVAVAWCSRYYTLTTVVALAITGGGAGG